MARTVEVGSVAIVAVLRLKFNSRNKFVLYFWNDVENTVPASLAGTSITIEIDDPDGMVTWTSVILANSATFDQPSEDVQFSWDAQPFRVMLAKTIPVIRETVITGEVAIQR